MRRKTSYIAEHVMAMAGYVAVAVYAASSAEFSTDTWGGRYSQQNNHFLPSGDGMQRSSLKLLRWSPGPDVRPRASWSSAAVPVQRSLLLVTARVSGTYLPRGPQIIFIVNHDGNLYTPGGRSP